MKPMNIKLAILERSYQRNGISGIGFEVFKIRCDGQTLIATVATDDREPEGLDLETCRVLDPLDLEAHYRGDCIGDALVGELARARVAAKAGTEVRS